MWQVPHVREESEQGFSTKGEKLEVEMSCSSLKQDNGLTLAVHFSTEPEQQSSVEMMTVTLTEHKTRRQRQGKRSSPRSCSVTKQVRRSWG